MSFATGFASVALQVFVNTGMLNLINNKSLIFEKKKISIISTLFYPKNTFLDTFFFCIITDRWSESLHCIKPPLKCFPGEKSQLIDSCPCPF